MKTRTHVPEIDRPAQIVAGCRVTLFAIAALLEVAWLLFLLWMTRN
jgi:hypothetical protein